jgi:3-methyladenine DNA glycosylase AlkD
MILLKKFKSDLSKLADKEKALILQRFFKTGKGEYGEGDQFLGVIVPKQRQLIKAYYEMNFAGLAALLDSEIHEERLSALLILVHQYAKAKNLSLRKEIYDFYLEHTARINNWDLVDLSAPNIVGWHLFDNKELRGILDELVVDENLWKRRIAMIATAYFIRKSLFTPTLKLAKNLLHDEEDLIHKAVGWMLREVGKRDFAVLQSFMQQHYKKMPRTMLRYAIERFPENLRQEYLKK